MSLSKFRWFWFKSETQRTWMGVWSGRKRTCRGNGTLKTHFYGGLNNYLCSIITKKKKKNHELIINGQYGSRKKGTYFQIMDDFLNFFKTSLFWSPIRGCSLKQRLKEKKHSCSNTINAVAVQKNSPTKMAHRYTSKTPNNQSNTAKQVATDSDACRALSVLTSRSYRGRSSNRCCSSHAGCRRSAMTADRAPGGQKLLYRPFTLGRLLALNYVPLQLHMHWGRNTCFLHRVQMQSHWSDTHSARHTEAWGPAVQKTTCLIYFTAQFIAGLLTNTQTKRLMLD